MKIKEIIFGKKNRFWTGENFNRLIEEKTIVKHINQVIDKLKIREGENKVLNVYLFGSVINLIGKQIYWKEPNDLDLYFHMEKGFNSRLEEKIRKEIKSLTDPYNLKEGYGATISSEGPFQDILDGKIHKPYRKTELNSIYTLYSNL